MQYTWKGRKELLLAQLVRLVEQFIRSDKIAIHPPLFYQDELHRRLIITLNMTRVVQHIWDTLRFENTERLEPVFDRNLDEYKRPDYKEARVRAEFIDPFLESLGWDVRNVQGRAE